VFLVLFFRWFGNLDDDRATVELCLVQSVDGLLGGLDGGESNETITSRTTAIARPALNDLSADTADGKKKMSGRREENLDRADMSL